MRKSSRNDRARGLVFLAAAGVLQITIAGCLSPTIRSSASEGFRNPSLAPSTMNGGAMALLPTTSPTGIPVETAGGLEGLKRVTNGSCEDAFQAQFPGTRVVNATESLQRINAAGIARDYADLLDAYERTSIVDGETLKKMGSAVRSRFLLHSRITGYRSWSDGDKQQAEVAIFAQLWDSDTGDIAWEGNSTASASKTMFDKPFDLEMLTLEACTALMGRLSQY